MNLSRVVSKMKICVITGIFPPDSGGPATYVPKISKELVSLGHQVSVITHSDNLEFNDAEYNFQVLRIERGFFKPFRFLQTIWQIVKVGRNSELLFVNGLGLESAIAKRIIRKPMVCKVVSDIAWERANYKGLTKDGVEDFQNKKYSFPIELLKTLRSFYVRIADAVITPSQHVASLVEGWKIDPSKINVIYNAIDIHDIPLSSRSDLRLELNLSRNVVLTVGRLIPLKRVDQIIKVISQIETANLVIVGDGPQELELKKLSLTLGCADRIRFTSRLNQKEVYKYMKASDVFVLNSITEGLPLVIIEAMSCGLPVIATNVGGTPEIVKDRETGLLIEPGNKEQLKEAIECLLIDRDLRGRLVENARKQLGKFSWAHLVEQTLEIILLQGMKSKSCKILET